MRMPVGRRREERRVGRRRREGWGRRRDLLVWEVGVVRSDLEIAGRGRVRADFRAKCERRRSVRAPARVSPSKEPMMVETPKETPIWEAGMW